jgi:hypothetical protein
MTSPGPTASATLETTARAVSFSPERSAVHVRRGDLDPGTRRAGWLEILARDDTLAAACVREKMMWDHGKDFPSGNAETVDPGESPLAAEWAGRLIPAPRTAAFDQLSLPEP